MEVRKKISVDFTRVFDIIEYQKEKYPNPAALNVLSNKGWTGISIEEVQSHTNHVSCWLIRAGLKKDDKVIFIPHSGSAAWMMLDYACQQLGIVTVPVHPNARDEEWTLIIRETRAKLAFTADLALFERFQTVAIRAGNTVNTHHFHANHEGYLDLLNVPAGSKEEQETVTRVKADVQEDDLCTILYTSGSSGVPKGVMLSHRNIVFNIKSILTLIPLEPQHRVLSFLPFSHIFERATCYSYLAFGVSLYFSEGKENFTTDFQTVRPHFCTAVPRVLEKMYDYLEEQMLGKNAIKRHVIGWALAIGKRYGVSRFDPWFRMQLTIARLLVLGLWRKKLGGHISHMITGAAALQPEIARLFWAAGVRVVEGYGMTETAPLITVNRFEPGMHRFGTVGLTIPGIDVKIDSPNEDGEGEILVKGPNVTQGYFNQAEQTRATFTPDGWLMTGDVGKFVEERFLKITDRKKEIFKTSAGKYIAPQQLQNHFMKSSFIERCLIVGFQRPYVTALILPNFEMLERWCIQEGIHWTAPQFMIHNIKVRSRMADEIKSLNEPLPNFETIRNFVLCHQPWTAENGEMTTTFKPVRRVLEEHYKTEIEKMYE